MRSPLAMLLAALGALGGPPDLSANPDQTFAALEQAWSAAYHRHDLPALERLLADEFVGIDGRGVVSTRKEELEEAKPPAPGTPAPGMQILGEKISDVHARIYGETAVATALNTATVRTPEGENTVRFRRTTVWVKRAGRWQCVHFHASRIL